jgi:hypothetical protein
MKSNLMWREFNKIGYCRAMKIERMKECQVTLFQ